MSDRIGIIAHGSLECLGSSLHLKNRFADGYKIVVNFREGNEEHVLNEINNLFPQAKLAGRYKNSLDFQISLKNESVSIIFEKLLNNAEKMGIEDWSIGQANFEDVFAKIVEKAREREMIKEEDI